MAGSFFFQGGERERPTAAPGLEPGKVVGDFRLISLIGQGGMGQVWEAAQTSLGDRPVAVKFVRPDRVTPRQLELFQREARAGGRLSHPGIVAVYGYGESDGLSWIAMEYVEGCWTLRDFLDEMIRQDGLPADYDTEVARFIAEVAEAVQAAHDAGVIHRDLKPQNILIAKDDKPKVTDFGLARITDESEISKTGDFAGTYFYMSPEQVAARRAGIDHRTDVFSLGAVLYEMLTLRRPFEGDTTHQVAAQILAKDAPDPRTIRPSAPSDLVVIAGQAMEKDPDRRYATMTKFAADVRRHSENKPIEARPPSWSDRLVKWTKGHPTMSVATAMVLAFGLFTVLLLKPDLFDAASPMVAPNPENGADRATLGGNGEFASARVGLPLPALTFKTGVGGDLSLADYKGRFVLVVLMSSFVDVCVYCSEQPKSLALDIDEFDRRGVEVLVVYPGEEHRLDDFLSGFRDLPLTEGIDEPLFEMLFDPGAKLFEELGFHPVQEVPATFLIDRDGIVQYAYVARTLPDGSVDFTDRPSTRELLQVIDLLLEH